MSALLVRYAEEKAKRLSLRSKTNVGTVSRLLGRTESAEVVPLKRDYSNLVLLQRQFYQQEMD